MAHSASALRKFWSDLWPGEQVLHGIRVATVTDVVDGKKAVLSYVGGGSATVDVWDLLPLEDDRHG